MFSWEIELRGEGEREGEKENGGEKVYTKRDRETEWEEKRERIYRGT